jgi:hypothetical protein
MKSAIHRRNTDLDHTLFTESRCAYYINHVNTKTEEQVFALMIGKFPVPFSNALNTQNTVQL